MASAIKKILLKKNVRVERAGAAFQRIVLGGEALEGFASHGFDDHTKLFFPEPGAAFTPPQVTEEGIDWGEGVRPATRDYTPLYDAERHELAYDFYIHDGGIASRWALEAKVGDKPTNKLSDTASFPFRRFQNDAFALALNLFIIAG